jgi:hypothetical protein
MHEAAGEEEGLSHVSLLSDIPKTTSALCVAGLGASAWEEGSRKYLRDFSIISQTNRDALALDFSAPPLDSSLTLPIVRNPSHCSVSPHSHTPFYSSTARQDAFRHALDDQSSFNFRRYFTSVRLYLKTSSHPRVQGRFNVTRVKSSIRTPVIVKLN